jgi:flagellar biosynthesis/type III secretory pathway protein FliH
MTKRSIDAGEAAACIKRHCIAAIVRASKRPSSFGDVTEALKRLRLDDQVERPLSASIDEPAPEPSSEQWKEGHVVGHTEGHATGYTKGLDEGRQMATEAFLCDVVPEMERLVKAALGELNNRYDDLFLELCSEFGHSGGRHPHPFVY